jgi:hypothetical protein
MTQKVHYAYEVHHFWQAHHYVHGVQLWWQWFPLFELQGSNIMSIFILSWAQKLPWPKGFLIGMKPLIDYNNTSLNMVPTIKEKKT